MSWNRERAARIVETVNQRYGDELEQAPEDEEPHLTGGLDPTDGEAAGPTGYSLDEIRHTARQARHRTGFTNRKYR